MTHEHPQVSDDPVDPDKHSIEGVPEEYLSSVADGEVRLPSATRARWVLSAEEKSRFSLCESAAVLADRKSWGPLPSIMMMTMMGVPACLVHDGFIHLTRTQSSPSRFDYFVEFELQITPLGLRSRAYPEDVPYLFVRFMTDAGDRLADFRSWYAQGMTGYELQWRCGAPNRRRASGVRKSRNPLSWFDIAEQAGFGWTGAQLLFC